MDDKEFEEALAKAVGDEPLDAEPEQQQIEVEPETVEPEAVEETEPEPEPETPGYAPEIAEFLAKYDGDVEKALKAAVHAQSKIGEQGQELGELRRMVQEIYERPEPQTPTSPFVPENIQEAIEANPSQVVQWAQQTENPVVFEAAMREWYEQDPYAASSYREQQLINAVAGAVQMHVEPELQTVRQQEQARQVVDAHRALTQKYPDFQQVMETATADEVAGIDRNLLAAAQQNNPSVALEMLYRWVASGRREQAAARTEQVRQEKREASVVTSDATVPAAEPDTMERLKALMLDPEPQSVAHGLTH